MVKPKKSSTFAAKFTNLYFTYLQLAKKSHLKTPAKVIKIYRLTKKNYKIMKESIILEGIKPKCITQVDTQIGYLQVLEYVLQDDTLVHVVQWHFINILEDNSFVPKTNCKSFYKERNNALKLAYKVGKLLLQQ